MSTITIEKATILDAEKLTEIMRRTFDEETKRWLSDQENIIDYNIQPPGYSSIEMTAYMIEELEYFKVVMGEETVGGIIVTISGTSYGRIDRIFVDPAYQGKGIGSQVISLIEGEFQNVRTWDLETSSRQINNHYFYKKMGYETIFETEEEYCYVKRIVTTSNKDNLVENKDMNSGQYESCNMENTEYYQVNLKGGSFSNSNLMDSHISNCNFSHSKFRNINLKNSLYADLNLSNSKFKLVTFGGVHFTDINLGEEKEPISFERCDLEGSKINNSNLKNVEIQNSDITGMKINNIPVAELLELYDRVNNNVKS
ncbi:GNAT family N-acetyltransferase [Bacillus clarus]|uniref:Acetyltransferase domain protein n=1 Tax=Bacillus clarus TaxID=2338372 RepID=A0A090YV61_9BACI|nr:GNAT family N-acetyltransferase [Bacillus clarus]KFN02300.1 acetyltransferase domain protein [Bacillus clarus]RFT67629.1 GNAT family N-acetyltransferase [Bacillus clarus]